MLLFAGGLSASVRAIEPVAVDISSLACSYITCLEQSACAGSPPGWVFGVAHFMIGLNWIATAFTTRQHAACSDGLLSYCYRSTLPLSGSGHALAWRISHQHRSGSFSCSLRRGCFRVAASHSPDRLRMGSAAAAWLGCPGLPGCGMDRHVWLSGLRYSPRFALAWNAAQMAHHLVLTLADGRCNFPRTVDGRRQEPRSAGAIAFRIVQRISDRMKRMTSSRPSETRAVMRACPERPPRAPIYSAGRTTYTFSILSPKRDWSSRHARAARLLMAGGESVTLDLHGNDDVYHNTYFTR